MTSQGKSCPKCGTDNPRSAAYCYLCQAPIAQGPAEGGGAPPAGAQALQGESGGTSGTPAPGAALRTAPMLLFTDAIRHNVRMSSLLFALLLAFFLLLGTVIGEVYGDVGRGLGLAAVLYAILAGTAYFSGSSLVLSLHDAREADPERHRQLLNVVEEMRIAAGLPSPKVYVMPSAGMNAFAAGRNPREAGVAVTQGLLDRLNREELQGVIAHELAHIKGRDTLYYICAAVLVGAIALLAACSCASPSSSRAADAPSGAPATAAAAATRRTSSWGSSRPPRAAGGEDPSDEHLAQREFHPTPPPRLHAQPAGLASALSEDRRRGSGCRGKTGGRSTCSS